MRFGGVHPAIANGAEPGFTVALPIVVITLRVMICTHSWANSAVKQ